MSLNRFQRATLNQLSGEFNNGDSHVVLVPWYDAGNEMTYRWLRKVAIRAGCSFTLEKAYGRIRTYTVATFTRLPEEL